MYLIKHNGAKVTEVKEYPGAKVIRHDAKKSFTVDSLDGLAAKLKKLAIEPLPMPPTQEEIAREEAAMAVIAEGSLVEKENFALARGLPDEKKEELTSALRDMLAR